MAGKSPKAAFANQLASWRSERFEEMQRNLDVWKEIRDDPEQDAKDRNEAAKNIAKALGGLGADRTAAPPARNPNAPEGKEEGFALSPEKMAALDSYLKLNR
jgi:hypothetical protein